MSKINRRVQIETVQTPSTDPRFTLTVDGVPARVTRYGTDAQGRTHFELTGEPHPATNVRDAFPTDRGYVKGGEVYMVSAFSAAKDAAEWEWEYIGPAQSALLRPAESIAAEEQQTGKEITDE